MEKEIIIVPKNKCPLEVINGMGDQLKSSWVFIHENAYQHLLKSEGASCTMGNKMNLPKSVLITWYSSSKFPKSLVFCEVPPSLGWSRVPYIELDTSIFRFSPPDPNQIFFFKM